MNRSASASDDGQQAPDAPYVRRSVDELLREQEALDLSASEAQEPVTSRMRLMQAHASRASAAAEAVSNAVRALPAVQAPRAQEREQEEAYDYGDPITRTVRNPMCAGDITDELLLDPAVRTGDILGVYYRKGNGRDKKNPNSWKLDSLMEVQLKAGTRGTTSIETLARRYTDLIGTTWALAKYLRSKPTFLAFFMEQRDTHLSGVEGAGFAYAEVDNDPGEDEEPRQPIRPTAVLQSSAPAQASAQAPLPRAERVETSVYEQIVNDTLLDEGITSEALLQIVRNEGAKTRITLLTDSQVQARARVWLAFFTPRVSNQLASDYRQMVQNARPGFEQAMTLVLIRNDVLKQMSEASLPRRA